MPIKRDEFGIICQHDPTNPGYLDGGDSANRTAMMALCGSEQDIKQLPKFIVGGKLVRHPCQPKWNDPAETSRDQLVPVLAALWRSPYQIALNPYFELLRNYRFRINKDVLLPHHRLQTGFWLKADIWWNCKVKPWHEQNQIQALCIAAGPEWVKRYVDSHPDFRHATRLYWGGPAYAPECWRGQAEIGELIIAKLEAIYGQ